MKLRLYSAAIISVLTYGCSGWELTSKLLRFLNGWNGERIAFITEKGILEECRDPTFDLVARGPVRKAPSSLFAMAISPGTVALVACGLSHSLGIGQ